MAPVPTMPMARWRARRTGCPRLGWPRRRRILEGGPGQPRRLSSHQVSVPAPTAAAADLERMGADGGDHALGYAAEGALGILIAKRGGTMDQAAQLLLHRRGGAIGLLLDEVPQVGGPPGEFPAGTRSGVRGGVRDHGG